MNRHYRVITSLENAARIERTVFEYRKLVLGLIARVLVAWEGGESFFISAIEQVQTDGSALQRTIETFEHLFCFPTKVPPPDTYDFERFAYNCPQYYLRQAIVSALGGVNMRAKFLVRPHFEREKSALRVLDVINSAHPWFSMQGSELGLYLNLNDYNAEPGRRFFSDLDEVFRRPVKDKIFKVKLIDIASRSWIWCELFSTHGATDVDLATALEEVPWTDPILLPEEMICWHESHLMRDLYITSARSPDFASENEFQDFKGIELPPSFVSYGLGRAEDSKPAR